MFIDKPPAIIIPRPKELVKPDRRLIVPAISFISSGRFGAPISNTFLQIASDNGAATTHTFSSQNIGAADATRRIICGVFWSSGALLSSATIGGVSATSHTKGIGPSTETVEIISALVPTGTTATVVLNFSISSIRTGVALWRQVNESSSSPFATANNSVNGTPIGVTINIPDNGSLYAIAESSFAGAGGVNAWTGATERFDQTATGLTNFIYSGASETGLGAQTGRTVQTALSGASTPSGGIAVVSWG